MVIPTRIAEKGSAPSFHEREETRSFYTETLLHTESFTRKHFYTQTLSHRDIFSCTHTQTHFHTETLTLKHFNTHTLLYTDTFTHTYAFTCRWLFTDAHTLSHTNAFTHRSFYTQTIFHTDPFTHRRFYTQTFLHTDASTETFTQRRSQSAAPLGDLSCKQRCANIVAMEMLQNRKSAQDQAQYHDQRTIQCKASAL